MGQDDEFARLVQEAERASFSGWDFSWLKGRMDEDPEPWNYAALVKDELDLVTTLLDVGTGGGERLARLAPLPPETYATEAYPPNVAVARERLEPLGVQVVETRDEGEVPFPDSRFDLVVDRHTGVPASKVYRVLRTGGRYITEQVGSRHNWELRALLAGEEPRTPPPSSLDPFRQEVERAGFTVNVSQECFPATYIRDIGAVVYYLRAIPWFAPEFSLDAHRDRLRTLHVRISEAGPLRVTSHYFLVTATKGPEV